MTGTIQKLQRFNTNPQPDGAQRRLVKKYVKHVQPHPTHTMNQKMTQSIIGIQPRHHRHTPTTGHTPHSAQNKAGKHTHATKVHWHTIEFSNNTSTPKPTHTTVSQPQVTLESASDCFPARHTNRKESHSPAGRCRSR